MSEPKRYAIRGFSAALVEEDNGVFIRYEDYAALLATNERVCQRFAKTQVEANEAEAEVARLKAERDAFKLFPPIMESNAIPEGQAVLVNIYQHQQDAAEIARLKAENNRLSIEVKRLTTALQTCDRIIGPLREKAQKENERR